MPNPFNTWCSTELEREWRAWWRHELKLHDEEVYGLIDPNYPRLITLNRTHLSKAQVYARIQKLADIKKEKGYKNMKIEAKQEVQAALAAMDDGVEPKPEFSVGTQVVYTGQPLRMPDRNNFNFSVLAGAQGKISEPADKPGRWMVTFTGFVGEVEVPESDLRRADAPKLGIDLGVGDLVFVSMKGEGVIAGLRAGGDVAVTFNNNFDQPSWVPRSLINLIKTREQLQQDKVALMQQQIDTLTAEKAAAVDRASVYQQRAEQAEQKASTPPVSAFGELDEAKQEAAKLRDEVVLLKTQVASLRLAAADDVDPGIEVKTLYQDMHSPERQAAADNELTMMRRVGWDITHIQFTPDLSKRVITLEINNDVTSPIDTAIRAAIAKTEETPLPVEVGIPAQYARAADAIFGLDDDEPVTEGEFVLDLDTISYENAKRLFSARVLTADEMSYVSNRQIKSAGLRAAEESQATRRTYVNPFRVPALQVVTS